MKTLTKWMMAAFAAVAVVGCDPFTEAVGGPPAVMGAGFSQNGSAFEATLSGTAWTASGVTSICGNTTAGAAEAPGFIYVKFNKLLNGDAIQTTPTNCTPVGALNLAVTYNGSATPPAGTEWYACYTPSAPAPTEGASIFIFLGQCQVAGPNCTTPAAPPSGWFYSVPIPTSGDAVTAIHATGVGTDKGGATATFDVTADIDPDPGVPGTPTFGTVTATSVVVNWAAAECGVAGSTVYHVERAPNVPTGTPPVNAPGTFAPVCGGTGQPACPTALTFTDTGLTTATVYWYRVTAVSSGGVAGVPSGSASVTTL